LEFVEMFFNEAQIAASIDHPAVCALYDFGRSKDTYFLAMEYLVGETFEQVTKHLRQQAKGLDRARVPHYLARLTIEICEGLHAVHEAIDTQGGSLSVVHGDITPRNLFALYDGSARVTDFGSAFSRDQPRQHAAGVGKGKLAYMSPEQLTNGAVDRRSDIWSLGVVLWEMLAQTSLFAEDNISATVRAVRELEIAAPSSVNALVPAELDRIVLKALSREVPERYNSAREMAVDLELFLARQHDLVAPAELTGWLEQLFPGEAERKRVCVRTARSMVDGTGVKPPPLRAGAQAREAALATQRSNDNTVPTAAAVSSKVTSFGRERFAAVALLVVALLLLAAAFLWTRMPRGAHLGEPAQSGQAP
jgi:serine/threonine-protein kinase